MPQRGAEKLEGRRALEEREPWGSLVDLKRAMMEMTVMSLLS